MSEYTRVMFGTMEQGQADFARTYSSLQSTVSNLDSQLRANLAEWDGAAQRRTTRPRRPGTRPWPTWRTW